VAAGLCIPAPLSSRHRCERIHAKIDNVMPTMSPAQAAPVYLMLRPSREPGMRSCLQVSAEGKRAALARVWQKKLGFQVHNTKNSVSMFQSPPASVRQQTQLLQVSFCGRKV
jgi:hypothetical protein